MDGQHGGALRSARGGHDCVASAVCCSGLCCGGRRCFDGQTRQAETVADPMGTGHAATIGRIVNDWRSRSDVLLRVAAVRVGIDRDAKLALEDHGESRLRLGTCDGDGDAERAPLSQALRTLIR